MMLLGESWWNYLMDCWQGKNCIIPTFSYDEFYWRSFRIFDVMLKIVYDISIWQTTKVRTVKFQLKVVFLLEWWSCFQNAAVYIKTTKVRTAKF